MTAATSDRCIAVEISHCAGFKRVIEEEKKLSYPSGFQTIPTGCTEIITRDVATKEMMALLGVLSSK